MADAASYKIPRHFKSLKIIYMYNPFEMKIMTKMLDNNIQVFKEGTILIYLNDLYRREIKNYLNEILIDYRRNEFFQISVFYLNKKRSIQKPFKDSNISFLVCIQGKTVTLPLNFSNTSSLNLVDASEYPNSGIL